MCALGATACRPRRPSECHPECRPECRPECHPECHATSVWAQDVLGELAEASEEQEAGSHTGSCQASPDASKKTQPLATAREPPLRRLSEEKSPDARGKPAAPTAAPHVDAMPPPEPPQPPQPTGEASSAPEAPAPPRTPMHDLKHVWEACVEPADGVDEVNVEKMCVALHTRAGSASR